MPAEARARVRDRLLQAAQSVALRQGAVALTLERVAAVARVSKGGLLYHFPDKASLMLALIEAFCRVFDRQLDRQLKRGKNFAEAFVVASTRDDSAHAARALIAVVAHNPALLEPLRLRYAAWQKRLETTLDADEAALIRFAIDGIWFSQILQLPTPRKAVVEKMQKKLLKIAQRSA